MDDSNRILYLRPSVDFAGAPDGWCALGLTARLHDPVLLTYVRRHGEDDIDTEFTQRGYGGLKHNGNGEEAQQTGVSQDVCRMWLVAPVGPAHSCFFQ